MSETLDKFHKWAASYLAPDASDSSSGRGRGGDDDEGSSSFQETYERWHDWAASILAPPVDGANSKPYDTSQGSAAEAYTMSETSASSYG